MTKLTTLDFSERRHFISRVGLGAEIGAIKHLKGKTKEMAVSMLLRQQSYRTANPPAMTTWNVRQNMYESGNASLKMKMHRQTTRECNKLKQWWISQMLTTQSPLLEKMTLLWHGHFTSSLDKTEQPSLNYKQNMLFRQFSLGNFAAMLKAVAKDPAMSIYLDGHLNEKGNPNENFARELLELFTLGRGHYTEEDIREVARAFTGWGVNRYKERHTFNSKQSDHEAKTVLGKKVYTGDDVVKVLLDHPRTALTVAEKFWNTFISDTSPDEVIIEEWADTFRESGYEIKALLKVVLLSDVFWSDEYKGTLTKSPADLIIGTLRTLPFKRPTSHELVGIFRLLGQDLFDPPNVKGWKGGQGWLNSQTVMVRTSLLSKLSGANLNAKVNKGRYYSQLSNKRLRRWLLPHKPVTTMPTTPGKVRLVRSLVLDPYYQFL